ncbi:MAG: DNA-directed RNA polymerase subunit omega [Candidatus Caldatribacteriota bacterium]
MDNNNYLDNKYLLTMMVAKRAKQLNQGSKPLVETNEKNTRVTALKEIVEGKVYPKDRIQDQGQDED